jgi:hypothetical protein
LHADLQLWFSPFAGRKALAGTAPGWSALLDPDIMTAVD